MNHSEPSQDANELSQDQQLPEQEDTQSASQQRSRREKAKEQDPDQEETAQFNTD